MKLKDHRKIRFPKHGPGSSYDGSKPFPNPELSNWVLVSVGQTHKKTLSVHLKSKDTGNEGHKPIGVDDKQTAEYLKRVLVSQIGKTMREISELEVDAEFNIL